MLLNAGTPSNLTLYIPIQTELFIYQIQVSISSEPYPASNQNEGYCN